MIIRLKSILAGFIILLLIGATIRLVVEPFNGKNNAVPAIGFNPPVKVVDQEERDTDASKEETPPQTRSSLLTTALEYKLQVSRARSLQLDNMKTLIDTGSESEAKRNAEKDIAELSKAQEYEIEAETAAKSLGYQDVVVSMNGQSLRVFIDQVLSPDKVTVLGSVIAKRTGIAMEKIIIVQKQNG